jgi:hypothetical protein
MAWEALVEAHTAHALNFLALLADRVAFEDALTRYIREMDVSEPMTTAVRTAVLVALEDAESEPPRPQLQVEQPASEEPEEGWRRFTPGAFMRGVKESQRSKEEVERWILLAIARSEEAVLNAHVDNAITFAALLEQTMPLDRAVQEYIRTVGLAGSRAQSAFQRTMARLAETYLPAPDPQPRLVRPAQPRRSS